LCIIFFACSEKSKTKEPDSQNSAVKEDFIIVEELPEYESGMDAFYTYVKNEMNYPLFARNSGIEGNVFAQFVIDKDGSVTEIVVVRGIGAGCDEEVARVLKNAGLFKPASQRGKNVRVRKILPVVFKIDESKTNPDGSPQGIIIVEDLESANGEIKVEATFTNGEWSGTVYSAQGEALPGANIIVKGTNSGTVSDLDGTFKLKSLEEEVIVISFVGYETVSISNNN
jgi:TonB family protein